MIFEFFKSLLEFIKAMNPLIFFVDLQEFIYKYRLMNNIFKDSSVIDIINANQPEKLRIDSLNRIYTIVNFPPDVNTESLQFQFLIEAFRKIDETLLRCQLNDVLIPFTYNKGGYYLVILSPYSFYINWQFIFAKFISLILILVIFYLSFNVIENSFSFYK